MIKFENIPQYTRLVKGVRFPQKKDRPYAIIYFPENSSLALDYKKLGIMQIDARIVVLPTSRRPQIRLTAEAKDIYKALGLRPFQSNMNFPKDQNIIVDYSVFANSLTSVLKINTFRQRGGILLQNMLSNIISFLNNYETILYYTVNLENPIVKFPDRKIFPFLSSMKAEEVIYDHLMMGYIYGEETGSRVLIRDKEYKFSRVLPYIRNVKVISTDDEKAREASKAEKTVLKKSEPEESKKQVSSAVTDYMKKDDEEREEVISKDITPEESDRITVKSILYKISGDVDKAKEIANGIPKKDLKRVLDSVNKAYADQILVQDKQKTTSTSAILDASNINDIVENKNPSHIFEKRKIDFETNLRKDLSNAFKVLEDREVPLRFQSISIKDKPQKAGEIRKTDQSIVTIKMNKANGETQDIQFLIPRIDPNAGTFMVKGRKKVLINQIIVNPISFPEEYVAKFASDYSTFRIKSIRTRKKPYLQIFMGSYKIAYAVVLSYLFGFEKTMKEYGIKYQIVEEKPKAEHFIQVPSSYMVFSNVTTELQKEFVESWKTAKISKYDVEEEFLSKQYFGELIYQMTGRIEATDILSKTAENIVDPVVKQILINQMLPSKLSDIMYYMAERAVQGIKEDPNDISNQRIRNSEIIVHLAQGMLLKAYTEYQQQYLSGNEDADINFPAETKLISDFDNIEISQDMEFANPMEEMSSITKIAPTGKTVGGISSKRAVQLEARNAHPSYFGNIDPVDTAEGQNIGITQQLTVNALMTSARGLIGTKEMSDDEKSGILSTNLSIVPFIENNEGARMIMSANQVRQYLPLKNPTPPMVQTGYESLLTNVLSDSFIKKAPCSGIIKSVSPDVINVVCGSKSNKVDISPKELASGSGKNTLSVFNSIVSKGDKVKKGQVIAEGSSISGGTIALGRNLATIYMAYKGFNFEDGLVINERLLQGDSLTSLHGVTLDIKVEPKDKILYIAKIGEYTKKGQPVFRKSPGEITELLDLGESDDEYMEIYEGAIVAESPGGKIVDIEIFSNIELTGNAQELALKTRKKYKNPKEKWYDKNVLIKGALVKVKVEQELPIGVGDKLCNRYGNKGIISLIEEDRFMPRTPWGETVDIIMNPLGVISRMNVGQIYELYCGLIAKEVGKRMVQAKSKKEVIALLSSVYSNLDGSKNSKMSANMLTAFKAMSDQKFKKMVDQIRTNGFAPIIIPPFQGPSRDKIDRVLKLLNLKTSYRMKLPEYNVKTQDPVPFGYSYVGKLEHLAAEKMHGRSTGPLTTKTFQPTAGKRKEGGQKVGEGDTWALASYNAKTLLSEMFGPMSDDGTSKKEMINEIVENGHTEFKETKQSPTRNLLNAYFVGLMLESK